MNTKNKEEQKKLGQQTRQEHGQKKQGQNSSMRQDHEQEYPETRMTR